jgi:hypothetical protein
LAAYQYLIIPFLCFNCGQVKATFLPSLMPSIIRADI